MASRQDVIDMLQTAVAALEREDNEQELLDEVRSELSDIYVEASALEDAIDQLGDTPINDISDTVSDMSREAARVKDRIQEVVDTIAASVTS